MKKKKTFLDSIADDQSSIDELIKARKNKIRSLKKNLLNLYQIAEKIDSLVIVLKIEGNPNVLSRFFGNYESAIGLLEIARHELINN